VFCSTSDVLRVQKGANEEFTGSSKYSTQKNLRNTPEQLIRIQNTLPLLSQTYKSSQNKKGKSCVHFMKNKKERTLYVIYK
jgi:hypothetical protein